MHTDADPNCPATALSRAEATTAIDRLLCHTARLRTLADDRYPLYAVEGHWHFSRRGSWTPGFWAGLLRLTARITGERGDRLAADRACQRLSERLDDDTVTRSLTFWYGTAADRPDLTTEAARRLLATARPETGVIPVGTAWGRGNTGRQETEVDCWGPLVRLLAWSAPELGPTARHSVRAQTRACLDGCLTATEPVRIVERLTAGPGQPRPASPATAAARPLAWALLGLAESATALSTTAPDLADDCALAAVRLSRHHATRTSGASATDTAATDTSADAITAVALHKLPAHTALAHTVTARLTREHLRPDGAFPGTRYRLAHAGTAGTAGGAADRTERTESVWGAFFLLLALAIDAELITPDEF